MVEVSMLSKFSGNTWEKGSAVKKKVLKRFRETAVRDVTVCDARSTCFKVLSLFRFFQLGDHINRRFFFILISLMKLFYILKTFSSPLKY